MNASRARLQAALSHRESDKVPFDLGSTKMTGISMVAYRAYLQYKNMTALDPEPSLFDPIQQLARPAEPFLQYLETDIRGLFPAPPDTWQGSIVIRENSQYLTDEWGIQWRKPDAYGLYFDLMASPAADRDLDEQLIHDFPWPDPQNRQRTAALHGQLDSIKKSGDFGMTLHGMMAGILEMALRLRGFENFFVDMVAEPQQAARLLNKLTDIKIAYWMKALPLLEGSVDVAIEVDDLGTQESLLVSPELYRTLVKPCHKRLIAAIKQSAPGIKVFFHSCGAVYPLLHDLVEIGVDILNPVQFSAAGMELPKLKKEFGQDITFWGGVVDTQKTLPYGKPQQIKDEVKRHIEILAPGGGYVINTVHNIQGDVPPQNLEALFEAIQLYR